MNHDVIPQGPTETITDGTIQDGAMAVFAETDLVITNLAYQYPKTALGAGTPLTGFTLLAGRYLFYVKAMTFTGTATIIYQK
jgi:hypothetical protein